MKNMNVKEFLQENIVYLDGGMGTLLQTAGLPLGTLPERWNITHADVIQNIHKSYLDAGSHIIATNTFGANPLKFSDDELKEIIQAAVSNARAAIQATSGTQPKFIALDVGPTGKLLKPYGDLDFEDAVACFAKTIQMGVACGVDLLLIETMNDCYETKAALLAAKENCDLPIFVSNAYGGDGKLMTGANPAAMVAMLEGMGADAVGVNCSVGPCQMQSVVEELLANASVPVFVKPNAGLPQTDGERTYYDINEKQFALVMKEFIQKGVRAVGGCCGTTPAYIRELVQATKDCTPKAITDKNLTRVSSYTHAVVFDKPILIGERINPTGKKRFKQALLDGDCDYILGEGLTQQEKGAHILDVNVGMPGIDEREELPKYVEKLQAVLNLPLQIDTANPVAMEKALRRYNGKALINSVNGKEESMQAVFPLVKKYGGVVVALTLDENGIPDTAEERVAIAEKILRKAEEYGIAKKDVIIDPLAMAISADKNAANVTLSALKQIKEKLGAHTSLGMSNVSFGLPAREVVNATFFARALDNGLSAAILNPSSAEMLKTYYAFLALNGRDENCGEYIHFATEILPQIQTQIQNQNQPQTASSENKTPAQDGATPLQRAIIKGMDSQAELACERLLEEKKPLDIVQEEIVPALDVIGKAYEMQRAYLPQLLMSAEAAKKAFEKIRLHMLKTGGEQTKKCTVVMATVKGDIHDIGKNIVTTLLENYGFDVVDLGRDVPPEAILQAVQTHKASVVGLSALMTTTLSSMEDTIRLLRENTPFVKIMVGGAVLTEEYAVRIGADGYAKDGIGAVRCVESFYADLCKK